MDGDKPRGKCPGRKAAEASPGGGGGSGGKSAAGGTSLSGTRVVARTAVTREQGESISCPFCGGRARGLQPFCPHRGRRLTAPRFRPNRPRCASPLEPGVKVFAACGGSLGG